jgi:hypothetical protein
VEFSIDAKQLPGGTFSSISGRRYSVRMISRFNVILSSQGGKVLSSINKSNIKMAFIPLAAGNSKLHKI